MRHASNEKRKMTRDGRSRTSKSIKTPNARRKGNLQILENIRNGHNQKVAMKKKKEIKTTIIEEPENYLRQTSIVGTVSNG